MGMKGLTAMYVRPSFSKEQLVARFTVHYAVLCRFRR